MHRFVGKTRVNIVYQRGKINPYKIDSIFEPVEGDGRTFAEMEAAERDLLSHRSRAFSKFREFFDFIVGRQILATTIVSELIENPRSTKQKHVVLSVFLISLLFFWQLSLLWPPESSAVWIQCVMTYQYSLNATSNIIWYLGPRTFLAAWVCLNDKFPSSTTASTNHHRLARRIAVSRVCTKHT